MHALEPPDARDLSRIETDDLAEPSIGEPEPQARFGYDDSDWCVLGERPEPMLRLTLCCFGEPQISRR